ncbi:MFS transporter [Arthrobacter sp. CAN_C5]|uniref:MFS transporter n=1 Tax=Arthrobacter sp. CAN_C5 TaxID=2760706 RepID=UPI001AE61DB1|nr:MFS transporter [Arthrobacter sp. CAN_C5]MBP2217056.1 putative MFS family arabinose efflux permease [Arthrobacter sp. CAN_C5]
MRAVGTILLVAAFTGSFAVAGAVAATLTIATAVAAPAIGRLTGKHRQSTLIYWTLPVHALATVALVLLVSQQAPIWTFFPAAALAGLATVPIGSLVRTRWIGATADTGYRPTAYALESVLDELIYIVGPVVVTALAVGVNPAAGLLGALALYVLGSLVFSSLRRTEPPIQATSATTPRTRSIPAGMAVLMGVFLLAGLYLGTLDIGIIAFAEEQESPVSAGVLLGLLAAGSAVSGFVYGARRWPITLPIQLLIAVVALAVGSLPLLAAQSLTVMAVTVVIAGLGLAPVLISASSLVGDLVTERSLTESLAWLSSAITLGIALGASGGGALVSQFDSTAALVLGTAGAILAALVTVVGLRALGRTNQL